MSNNGGAPTLPQAGEGVFSPSFRGARETREPGISRGNLNFEIPDRSALRTVWNDNN
jgi:hypothetical protein